VQVEAMEIRLYDAYGKLVNVVAANNDGTTQIDLSRFAPGVYFVKAVADGNVVAARKVVKR
ncbi:MAG: T9SS type A sorting domain-containing protein, partial [Bacteroidales bacterium]|nr:T9SS type A sorting domain-containing protein [Bacteroidales bacterium]